MSDSPLSKRDLDNMLSDLVEAIETGRDPEDVQRERHERETAGAAKPQPIKRRWWWR